MPRRKKVQEPFPILRLPPELRNRIWRYAVVKEGDVIIQKYYRQTLASLLPASRLRSGSELRLHREDDRRRVASKLAVAFTCRQIYLEATPIYYGENTFRLPVRSRTSINSLPDFKGFAEAIGSENAASILSVHLSDNYRLSILSYFPCLKRVEFFDTRFYHPIWISEVISYIQKHPSTVVMFEGRVWGLQEWISFAKNIGVVGD